MFLLVILNVIGLSKDQSYVRSRQFCNGYYGFEIKGKDTALSDVEEKWYILQDAY